MKVFPVKVKAVILEAFLAFISIFYKKQVFFIRNYKKQMFFLRFAAKLSIYYNSIPIEKLKTS